MTQVLNTAPSATALRVADILNYPGIVAAPVPDPEVFAKQVLTGFEQCLAAFNESRQREGAALAQVLLKYCTQIEDLVNTLRPKIPEILQAQKDKLTERLEEALGTTLADGAQITKEEVNERIIEHRKFRRCHSDDCCCVHAESVSREYFVNVERNQPSFSRYICTSSEIFGSSSTIRIVFAIGEARSLLIQYNEYYTAAPCVCVNIL